MDETEKNIENSHHLAKSIGQISLSDYDRVWSWNATVPSAIEQCVHHLVQKQAETQPFAPALCAWDGEISYGELEEMATRLAHHLMNLGVGINTMVPLCFEKSMWTVVAMLAVLKTGAAFVLLQPEQPLARLSSIIQQTAAQILLTSSKQAMRCSGLTETVVPLDASFFQGQTSTCVTTSCLPNTDPQHPMYLVFTSGTTGEPKGIIITHSSFATAIYYQAEKMGYYPSTRVYDYASYAFDASIQSIVMTLATGGCVCIASDDDRADRLTESLVDMNAELVDLTPTVIQTLDRSKLSGLKTLLLGGEAASEDIVQGWPADMRIINVYGPAECTPTSIIQTDCRSRKEAADIGQAAGSVSWVVDASDDARLLPIGEIGELLIEGPIVGCGYLNDEAKTATAFIEPPPWLVQGAVSHRGRTGRLYKTGDLVRYQEDGSLVFIGRKDSQVKINGQRVELGEVEHHVRLHMPGASQVTAEIIVPSSLEAGHQARPMLAAFVVTKDCPVENVTVTSVPGPVEEALSQNLPSYMVPSVFFYIDHIPRNIAGKTDRKRLQLIGASFTSQRLAELRVDRIEEKQMPSTAAEVALQHIWSRVLNLDATLIGVNDSFLRLGGDSITAMQASSEARSKLGNISTADILRHKTIHNLVVLLSSNKEKKPICSELAKLEVAECEPFGLSPIQQLYMKLEPEPRRCVDQNFLLQLRDAVDLKAVDAAIKLIISRHPLLRARFTALEGGIWQQRISDDISGSCNIGYVSPDDVTDTAAAIRKCRERLDIEHGPLVSAVLLDNAATQKLFISIHHLVVDFVSWRILFQDLEDILTTGGASAPLTTSFQTWCEMQKQYTAENLNMELSCADTESEIETYRPMCSYWGLDGTEVSEASTTTESFTLDKATTAMLLGSCNDAFGTRPVELMISALAHSFSLVFTDRRSPAMFSEGHGREPWDAAIDISRTMGWFTTLFPVWQGKSAASTSLLQKVREAKDTVRRLPANGWSWFTRRFASLAGTSAHLPAFPLEVLFNYTGIYQQLERKGAAFTNLPVPQNLGIASAGGMSKFTVFYMHMEMANGRLGATMSFDSSINHQSSIVLWMKQYEATLKQLANLLQDRSPEWTLADFPSTFDTYDDINDFRHRLASQTPPISPTDVEDVYACSPVQDGIRIAQAKDARNYQATLDFDLIATRVGAKICARRIEQAWRQVVQRHSILRAKFLDGSSKGSRSMQVILRDPEPSISHFRQECTAQPNFYTSSGLQHHMTITQDNDSCACISIAISHAIFDGYSSNLLMRDFKNAYHGRLNQDAPAYRNFIEYVGSQSRELDRSFWLSYLDAVEPCLFPALGVNQHCDDTFVMDVPGIDANKIRKFCADWEVTPATLVQTAWAMILRAYTGSEVPCFGTLTSGRDAPIEDVHEIFGPVIGMVPHRLRIADQLSVINTLRGVQNEYMNSLPHQTYPLLQIHQDLSVGSAGLFNTILSFQKTVEPAFGDDDEYEISMRDGKDPVEYDIAIGAFDSGSALDLKMRFKAAVATQFQAARVANAFSAAIDFLVTNPEVSLGSADILSDSDCELLWSWNATVPESVDTTVHSHVEDLAIATPDALAVCAWDGDLTYKELNDLSSRLAGRLVDMGVGPGVIVPLCFEKSKLAIVSIVAVLKVGAAFAPVDPSNAPEQRRHILEQTQASVMLTSATLSSLSSEPASSTVVVTLDYLQSLAARYEQNTCCVDPASAAYVIFTSGSTGKPKGVVIEHRSAVSSGTYNGSMLGLGKGSRIPQLASYAFDMSIGEILAGLMHGGSICIPSDASKLQNLTQVIKDLQPTILILTPTVANTLNTKTLTTLDTIVLGGEPITQEDLRRWEHIPRRIIAYGPTECTIACTMTTQLNELKKQNSIGRAVGSVSWVVDAEDHSKLAPIGAIGELLVEGPIVGRGYLHDKMKTMASFIESPPWLLRGAPTRAGRRGRLYKTGDLVQYQENGSLTFVGRKDGQVKINGQRVELGQVEYHVRASLFDAIQVVAEVITPDKNRKARPMLAAFVIAPGKHPEDGDEATVIKLTSQEEEKLAERLPSYMLPAVYFAMNSFPVNTSGKVDRKKLRAIGASFSTQRLVEIRAGPAADKCMPSTTKEIALLAMWASVLDLEPATIGSNDSFFRLGGDSVSAMALVATARDNGYNLAVTDVFNSPQLCEMTLAMTAIAVEEADSEAPGPFSLLKYTTEDEKIRCCNEAALVCKIDPSSIADAYPCTPLQEGLLALTAKSASAYIRRRIMRLGKDVDLDRFRDSWSAAIRQLTILRTRFVEDSIEGLIQIVVDENVEWVQANSLQEYIERDSALSMGLGHCLSRYALITEPGAGTATPEAYFVWTVHHALYDGDFLGRLWNLVAHSYHNTDMNVEGPKLRDFSHFVHYLSSVSMADSEDYWLGQLSGYESVPFPAQLTAGKQKAEPSSYAIVKHLCSLPCVNPSDITTATLIRAAWALTAGVVSETEDVVFGSTVSGRHARLTGISDIAGPVMATVPIRIVTTLTQTVKDFLCKVQQQSTDMVEYEQLGMQHIQRLSEDTYRASQFQTLVIVQPPQESELAGESDIGTWINSGDRDIADFTSYHLGLTFEPKGDQSITIRAAFNTNVLTEESVSLLMERFETVLHGLSLAVEGETLADLELLSNSDYERIWSWNKTVPEVIQRTVHSYVEGHAVSIPNAPAICSWDGDFTYGELNELSSRLAQRLVSMGVDDDVIVPLCFEKSKWTSVAMMAVLKAGGAFAPMDAAQPFTHLRTVVSQTRGKLMLCSTTEMSKWVGAVEGVTAIEVGSALLRDTDPTLPLTERRCSPNSAAYVVFTSGTTGTPKGVVVNHSAFISAIHYQSHSLRYDQATRVFDFASYAFDMASETAFFCLTAGLCLCVPSDSERKERLVQSLLRMNVDHVKLTPSVARTLDWTLLPNINTVLLGGEGSRQDDVLTWAKQKFAINTYGPSECTPCTTIEPLRLTSRGDISMGYAVGAVTWVVNTNDHNKLSPVGAVGELLIEGPIVGRGYLYDEVKTAASFIENPSWLLRGGAGNPGRSGRLYKTGDLVRYEADGTLVFIGRRDTQIKINGQRLELSEVEHQVRAAVPGIDQVAAEVLVLGDGTGQDARSLLVAFVTKKKAKSGRRRPVLRTHRTDMTDYSDISDADESGGASDPDMVDNADDTSATSESDEGITIDQEEEPQIMFLPTEVEEALSEYLPAYMVPTVFLTLDSIPLNTSGKTDRRKLHAIGAKLTPSRLVELREGQVETKRAPSSAMEITLQKIWARVLGISESLIGVDDSFFRLGGDSITAMTVVAVAGRDGHSLAVTDIFNKPKLSALALFMVETIAHHGEEELGFKVPRPFSLLQHNDDEDVVRCRRQASLDCKVPYSSIVDMYPCTPLQKGLLALTAQSGAAYTRRSVLQLTPDIDLYRFQAAWNTIVQSLPILRTRIVEDDIEGLLQVVIDETIEWVRASGFQQYLRQDCSHPMGLGDQLVRFAIVTEAGSSYTASSRAYFVWTMHHSLYDGHFLDRLIALVGTLYNNVEPAETLRHFRPFNSFVKYISDVNVDECRSYWENELLGYSDQPFPADYLLSKPKSQSPTFTLTDHNCVLDQRADPEITTATLIRAAWALTASAASATDDVVFGATVSGRHARLAGIDSIGGPTIATVPIRLRTTSTQNVNAFLHTVQRQATEMVAYEQVGLQNIQKLSDDAQRACQFQTLLVIQPSIESGSSNEQPMGTWQDTTEADVGDFSSYTLGIMCQPSENRTMSIKAAFRNDLLSDNRVKRLLERFANTLNQLAKATSTDTLADINTLAPSDYKDIWSWNQTVPEPVESLVHSLVERQVVANFDKPAVCAWDGDLTYKQLDDLATHVAHRLVSLGVGADVIVPLCFEKSMWTTVAMLAVLKAGGAFAPMDASHPLTYLRSMVSQTKAKIVLCSTAEAETWSDNSTDLVIIAIGPELFQKDMRLAITKLEERVNPGSAAYVIFTSGSTGLPKGVIVTHKAFSSAITYQSNKLGYDKTTRVFDFSSYAFDMSTEATFFCLAAGLCLCVPSNAEKLDNLESVITRMRVDHLKVTPSVARTIHQRNLPLLKTLILSGEEIREDDMVGWNSVTELVKTYGPAECTPLSTIETRKQAPGNPVTIGYGSGAITWIVQADDDTKLVPIGTVGELLIEGPIVGQGYLYDEEKTRLAFIESPTWLTAGAAGYQGRQGRLYKTGDLVRYEEDGSLVFVGRKDTQVKINGQRVELGQVESYIQMFLPEALQVAAEIIIPADNHDATHTARPLLAAFVSTQEHESSRASVMLLPKLVEDQLLKHLPPYMVPSVFFTVKSIPTSISSKIDRKKLRAIGASFTTQYLADIHAGSPSRDKRRPSTVSEIAVHEIWTRVLGLDPDSIGVEDSFFRLGGDSITAMTFVSAARREGYHLAVTDVFRNPKLIDLAHVIGTLNEEGDLSYEPPAPFSLLGHFDEESVTQCRTALADICQSHPDTIADAYPCTPLQKGLLAMTAQSGSAYIQRNVMKLSKDLDLDCFMTAWSKVVHLLPILRTRIVEDSQGGLSQVVMNEDIHWKYSSNLDHYVQEDSSLPMGLGQCLSRYCLVTETSIHEGKALTSTWFVWTIHHALYDGHFLQRLQGLLDSLYHDSEVLGNDTGFYDFSRFAEYLSSIDNDDTTSYWETELSDYDGVPFPPRPLNQKGTSNDHLNYEILNHHCTISNIVQSDLTKATIIRAAWALTAAGASSTDDVVFGSTVSGRHALLAGIDGIAGPTMATVPIRINTSSTQTASAFLQTVQQQSTNMVAYEQAGLQHIRQISESARRACQFQTLLVIQSPDEASLIGETAMGSWLPNGDAEALTVTNYALSLTCRPDKKGAWIIQAVFNTDYLSKESVRLLLARFEKAINYLAQSDNAQSLGDFELLSDLDYERIWAWNKTVPPQVDRTVHSYIEEHALTKPEAPAVYSWDGNFSYGELDRLSNRLAHRLAELGVTTDTIVPLCFEKSKWTAVAMLSVLKAGGAFAPMDASHPLEHLQSVVAQTGASVMLCSASEGERWSNIAGNMTAIIVGPEQLGSDDGVDAPQCTTALASDRATPASAMYVIFTSGSTGKPKGVVITHGAFASAITHQSRKMGYHTATRVFDFASYAFDVATKAAFFCFSNGLCLCVPSDSEKMGNLQQVITEMEVDHLTLTPSVVRTIRDRSLMNLKTFIFAGEAIREDDISGWHAGTTIIQGYGPAECTPYTTMDLRKHNPAKPASIGYGVGAVTWVADPLDHRKLTPIGAVGELLLEGPLLGRGYLNDKEKTTAAFIHDPPWLVRGVGRASGRHGRLYKTGDLVRYQEDGSLHFVGRKDTQVKINGQRVELAQVEHYVRTLFPAVSEAAAEVIMLDSQDTNCDARPTLAAFVVTKTDNVKNEGSIGDVGVLSLPESVEEALFKALPSYMVPSIFFALKSIPTNTSGKTDRKKLRAISASFTTQHLADIYTGSSKDKRRPSTASEIVLHEIWARVLGLDPDSIGADDSFFRLGGDSMSAMIFVTAARREGYRLTVTDVFHNPKLAALAQLAMKITDDSSEDAYQAPRPFSLLKYHSNDDISRCCEEAATACGLRQNAITDAYPCTPLQEGLLALTAQSETAYTMRSVMQLAKSTDLNRFCEAWTRVVRHLAILRTRIVENSREGLIQVVVDEDVQWIRAHDVQKYIEDDSVLPMGLGQPLARYALVTDPVSGTASFVWTVHHAVYDGHFLSNLQSLVGRFYHNPEAADPTTDLHHFSRFLAYLSNTDDNDSKAYWQTQLDGYCDSPFPISPIGTQDTSNTAAYNTAEHLCTFENTRHADITTATLVRAAWALTAAIAGATDDVVFGGNVSGRRASLVGVDAIMGPMIATVPIRVKFSSTQTIEDFLRQVQDQSTDMVAHEQTGIQHIQKISDDARRACQFQTILLVQPSGEDSLVDDNDIGTWVAAEGNNDSIGSFSSYPLGLTCKPFTGNTISLEAAYRKDYFSQQYMHLLLERFDVAIQRLATAMEGQTLGDLDLLPESEHAQIWSWNKRVPEAIDEMVHSLVEQQVATNPTAQAICAWDGDFSYKELNNLSNQLAYRLASLGVGPGHVVPLCFEKSKWATVAMLAALKVGGAFAPMDASQPFAHLKSMAAQTRATVVLCSRTEAARWSTVGEMVVLAVGSELLQHDMLSTMALENPSSDTLSPAYVIFTSGSTGIPKGVIVTHRAFSSAIRYQSSKLGYGNATRVFDFSSYAFDMATEATFFCLAAGLCLCVPSDTDRMTNLEQVVVKMRVDHLKLTPSVMRTLHNRDALPQLRTLILSGEEIRVDDMIGWHKDLSIIKTYGPAECSPLCTIEVREQIPTEPVTIGYGSGAVTWVVDANNDARLAPIGATGELLIEGPIVGHGYLHDEERTAAAFIKNPPWLLQGGPGEPGRCGRLYKTGDLVRYEEDGSLVFVGRNDTQVKINGQRIELSEVEYHLQSHIAGAAQVVAEVIIPKDEKTSRTTRPILVAFIAKQCHGIESTDGVKNIDLFELEESTEAALAANLPSYMVPALLFGLDHIPVNTSGKTDRKELRAIGADLAAQYMANARNHHGKQKRLPSTAAETELQQIWARLLNISAESIGVDDSFFRLGGDSITAMQVSSAARRGLGNISTVDILRERTISKLILALDAKRGIQEMNSQDASQIDTTKAIVPTEDLSLLQQTGQNEALLHQSLRQANTDQTNVEDVFPCSPMQEQIFRAQLKNTHAYHSYFDIEFRAQDTSTFKINAPSILAAWKRVVQRHSLLRAIFARCNSGKHQVLQIVLKHAEPKFTCYGQGDASSVEESKHNYPPYGVHEVQHYLRINLIDNRRAKIRIFINHAIMDGHSIRILLDDFQSTYYGVAKPEAPLYRDYIQYVTKEPTDAARAYWTKFLARVRPCQFPSNRHDSNKGFTYREYTPHVDAKAVLSFCSQHDTTVATLIKASWALVLKHYTKTDSPCFGFITSGRDAPVDMIHEIFGPTMSLMPTCVELDKKLSVLDVITHLDAEYHDSLPFQSQVSTYLYRNVEDGAQGLFNTALSIVRADSPNDETSNKGDGVVFLGDYDPVEYGIYVRVLYRSNMIKIVLDAWEGYIPRDMVQGAAKLLSQKITSIITQSSHRP